MAPVHDTDLSENRWDREEWRSFELWEKVEQRLRKRKRIWIAATLVGYVLLCSLPVFSEMVPKWNTLSLVRELADALNDVKVTAALQQKTLRLKFAGAGRLDYVVEVLESCQQEAGQVLRSGRLEDPDARFHLLDPKMGAELGVPGLVTEYCYDPLEGSGKEDLRGFAVIPVKDLTEPRIDRLSLLTINGKNGEISFD